MRGRGLGSRVLVVLAAIALLLALLAAYAWRTVVDSDQFANRAAAALRDDRVRTLIAERITDRVVLARQANLQAARPLIQSTAAEVVGSRAFSGLFRSAVRDVHAAVFARDRDTFTLTVADVGTVIAAALEQLRPGLARQIEQSDRVVLLQRDLGQFDGSVAGLMRALKILAIVLPLLTVALIAGALALAPDRRRTVVELGIGAAVAGVLLVVLLNLARSAAIDHVNGADEQDAAAGVWDAYLGDLRTVGWILAGCGAVVAAAAASLIRPVDIREPLARAVSWVAAEPGGTRGRALRGVLLVAVGIVVIVARDAVVALLVTAAGVYLVYAGLTAILRVIYRPPAEAEPRSRGPSLRRLIVIAAPIALIVIGIGAFVGTGGVSTAAPPAGPCNGHVELCDRSLDRVALAATHNSMSAPLPGWFSTQQDHPIDRQLRDGIRGLLIDTHYADRLPNNRLRTVLDTRAAGHDGVSEEQVAAALRIRDRLGFAGKGERGMYLCHSFCELGGTPLSTELDAIHTFLVANPGEVLVIINQDYVTPADFVGAMEEAKLDRFVYRGPVDGPWPTLREMIDSGQRLVVMAENHAGAAPWYHLVYKHATQETPFSFSRVQQLTDPANFAATCRKNRGPADAPLFLINHWITTDPVPLPSNAERVNAYDPLLARARKCQRVREHFPNLIAVDFYARGDVFRVVDTLHSVLTPQWGVRPSSASGLPSPAPPASACRCSRSPR
jgi:hypothetical protein